MNSVCSELKFTMELCQDFPDGRLPTLSFSLWLDKKGINHSYFEKSMRNQTLVVERSSMGRQALMSIMSNELVRRLDVLGELDQNEIDSVIDKYIQQLINSEYNWKQIREIIVSALLGYVRKIKRNEQTNKPRYRSGKQSLKNRVDKKLLEKLNWFKKTKKTVEAENGEVICQNEKTKNRWSHYRRRKEPIKSLDNNNEKNEPPKAVLFIQSTPNSELSHDIRKVIQDLKPWTGINIKVVRGLVINYRIYYIVVILGIILTVNVRIVSYAIQHAVMIKLSLKIVTKRQLSTKLGAKAVKIKT